MIMQISTVTFQTKLTLTANTQARYEYAGWVCEILS